MTDVIILNGVKYEIDNSDYYFYDLVNNKYELWFSLVGHCTNENIDPWEIFIDTNSTDNIVEEKFDRVIKDFSSHFCMCDYKNDEDKICLATGTIELLENSIHYYGTVDLSWNPRFNKNVSFDIYMSRYDIRGKE